MKLSNAGIKHLKGVEGFRDRAYWDRTHYAIGYGHNAPWIKPHDRISKADAEKLLAKDVAWAETLINRHVHGDLAQHEFDALVSFAFNVGPSAFKSSTLLKRLNAGDRDAVPREMMRWLKPPELRARREKEVALWNSAPSSGAFLLEAPMARNRPKELIIHCAATPEGKDFSVSDIDRWHKQRGWRKIGYHFVIYRDGSVHKGREEWETGAHVAYHNRNTLGICYIGGVDGQGRAKDTRTPAQKKALTKLIRDLVIKYEIRKIRGHRDYAAKACPSFDARREYAPLQWGSSYSNPKPLHKSRTIRHTAAAAGTAGLVTAESALGLVGKVREAEANFEAGDIMGLVAGAVIIFFAAKAMYARWDDAGRPGVREIMRGILGRDPDTYEA